MEKPLLILIPLCILLSGSAAGRWPPWRRRTWVLSTATATRVEWLTPEKNRGDPIVLFADAQGGRYLCRLGGDDFTPERV